MRINLNGNYYELKVGTEIKRRPLVEWPDNIRLDGQQQRKDRSLLSSWAIDSWQNGLGLERMNVALSSNQYRLWDIENCDTRDPSHIVLSPQFITPSIVASRGDLDLPLQYLGELYFCETQGTAGNIGVAHKFNPPNTLGSFRGISGNYGSLTSIMAVGGDIFFTYARDTAQRLGKTATLGGGLVEGYSATYSGLVWPQLAELGGTIHCITYQETDRTLYYHLADNALAYGTMTFKQAMAVGTYLAPLIGDGLNIYASTPRGIYEFTNSPSLIVDTSRAQDLNCRQVMFGQGLYFKNKKSLIEVDLSGVTTRGVGYDLEDGLPTEKFGEITAVCSSWKNIFAAVKGGTYSHILTRDQDGVWQYYARVPTAGLWIRDMFLSDAPDAIDRLWCIFGNYGYPGYFLNPMVTPLRAPTYSYVPTGHFSPPIFDGGLGEIPAGFYDTSLIADGMGGSNIITMLYGLNGGNPVSTLGVVATNTQTHTFGSPYGLEGYRIQPDFMLAGANSGTTPIFREAIVHYLKIPKERLSFNFTVDLKETARRQVRPLEDVIGSLNYERQLRTMIPFWYGQIGTKNVRVLQAPGVDELDVQDIYEGERTGQVDVTVAELL